MVVRASADRNVVERDILVLSSTHRADPRSWRSPVLPVLAHAAVRDALALYGVEC
jgi:hypothetical protein